MHRALTPCPSSGDGPPEPRGARAPFGGFWPQFTLIAVCAGYALGAALGWGSPRLALIMGDFGLAVAAMLACTSCLWYAFTRAGEFRCAWVLFGMSSLMIALGNAVWGWYEVVLQVPVPRFSVADVCFLLFAPSAIFGLLMLAKRPTSLAGWVCLALDASLIGGSLLIVSWSMALTHTAGWLGDSVARAALSLAYPVLDIALVSVVLVLHFRRTSAHRTAVNTAIGAFALTVLCDALFTSPLFREQYTSGQLLDAGWFAGSLLLACAPWIPGEARPVPPATGPVSRPGLPDPVPQWPAPRRPAGALASLLPYLAAAVCTVAILVTMVQHRQLDRVVVLSACAVVLALLLRQGITLLDNVSLTQELAHKESHFRSLVQGSSDVIMIAAPDGTLRYVSPAAEGVYGRAADTLVGRRLSELIHPEDLDRVQHELRRFLSPSGAEEAATRTECRVRHGSGQWLHVESSVNRHESGLIFNSRDVTDRVRLQAQLQHSASHDPLTDLPNRVLFTERVHRALDGCRDADTDAAVFYIDLDGFKAVNDSAGHQAGDDLLVQAGRRLREAVRAQDTTARLGGDEFAALLVGGAGSADDGTRTARVLEIAERIRSALSAPYRIGSGEIRVAASIGVAFAEPGCGPGDLLRRADLAMYRAKQAGRDRVEIFRARRPAPAGPGRGPDGDPAPCHDSPADRGVTARGGDPSPGPQAPSARRVPAQEAAFTLLHQPVVALADGRLVALSAQARWHAPQGDCATPNGLLAQELQESPSSTARPSDRAVRVVRRMLDEALSQAQKRWAAGCALPVGVRVPAAALTHGAVTAAALGPTLAGHSLPPDALILELTEAEACLARGEALRRLTELRALGVGIALDGLGAGPVPVSALYQLPVTEVRLAAELTAGVRDSRELHTITTGLVRLASDLGLGVVADGIDQPELAVELHGVGAPHGRGAALSPPLDEAALTPVLAAGRVATPPHHPALPGVPRPTEPGAGALGERPLMAAERRALKP